MLTMITYDDHPFILLSLNPACASHLRVPLVRRAHLDYQGLMAPLVVLVPVVALVLPEHMAHLEMQGHQGSLELLGSL